jgi:hypothetical protein
MHNQRAALLLLIPVAGMIALILFEVMRALAENSGFDEMPPAGMLVGVICLSALPVILLLCSAAPLARWTSFGIAALMSLFHGAHILEHALISDFAMTALILFTMFGPSLLAAIQIYKTRKPAAEAAVAA